MRSARVILATGLFAAISYAAPTVEGQNTAADSELEVRACDCVHNGDAGRWRDGLSPSGRLQDLCNQGGGCWDGERGRMCVSGDMSKCSCAITSAQEWESWSSDWWLWSAVTCGGLSVTIT